MSVTLPKILGAAPTAIRRFLNLFHQYSIEVQSSARQLGDSEAGTEATSPADLKFYIDDNFLHSIISLGLIQGLHSYEDLSDSDHRADLDSKEVESSATLKISSFDAIFRPSYEWTCATRTPQRASRMFLWITTRFYKSTASDGYCIERRKSQ